MPSHRVPPKRNSFARTTRRGVPVKLATSRPSPWGVLPSHGRSPMPSPSCFPRNLPSSRAKPCSSMVAPRPARRRFDSQPPKMRIVMINWIRSIAALSACLASLTTLAADPAYFSKYPSLKMSREQGVLVVEMNSAGKALKFGATEHEAYPDAFYAISRDRDNKVVILTGAAGDWMPDIDFSSFGNVADPDVWAKVHDEGDQVLDNLANIRVPMICAVEGKAWVHTEYCLLANVIVAGKSATFNDIPHFKGGIVPGDGVFTLWSYYAGPGRVQSMLLSPQPISASTAKEWGVVAEVVQ